MTPDRHESRPVMPLPMSNPPAHVFLVRVWIEESAGTPLWCGKVQHVLTGQAAAFEDPAALPAALLAILGSLAAPGVLSS